MGEASFWSSQFADGEGDVEKAPFARKPGPCSEEIPDSQRLTALGVMGKQNGGGWIIREGPSNSQ